MVKVCVVTSVHVANDTRVYFKEVKSLAKQFDVVYIAPEAELLQDESIKKVNITKPKSRFRRLVGFFKIWRLCADQNCEVYHLQDPELIIVGLLLKIFSRKKVIYDVHEDYPDYILQKEYLPKWSRGPLYFLMKTYERIAGSMFDAIVVADNFVNKRFPQKKTIIAYNFPDLSVFTLMETKPAKQYDLIYPGSLSKNMVNITLAVVKEVLTRKEDLKVMLISPFLMEGGKEWVRRRIKEEGINESVIQLMDRVPYTQVCNYMEESRIGFIPLPNTRKFHKNIPTKLFEYMFCGIPVVANDLPPTRQFVEGKNCCFLVDVNDSAKTASVILDLLADVELQIKMGETGNRLVKEQYNWEKEEKKLLGLYQHILGE